jgi:hypothetical protein
MEKFRDAKAMWRTALDPVYERLDRDSTSEAAAVRIKEALAALDKLQWDGNVKNFKAGGLVEELTLWFTTGWLKSDQEDQMLELLAEDLGLSDASTNCIQNNFFATYLAQAYSDPDKYRTDPASGWLRWLGTAFATKDRSRLGSIGNKNTNHWFTFTIDSENETIGYGDGFRDPPMASFPGKPQGQSFRGRSCCRYQVIGRGGECRCEDCGCGRRSR